MLVENPRLEFEKEREFRVSHLGIIHIEIMTGIQVGRSDGQNREKKKE